MPELKLPTLEELSIHETEREISAIIKRDSDSSVPFDSEKIVEAVKKASRASGKNYNEVEIKEFAARVLRKLSLHKGKFEYSGRNIPAVGDVEAVVLSVFDDISAERVSRSFADTFDLDPREAYDVARRGIEDIDHTGAFYRAYRARREKVRETMMDLPFTVEFSSTDKQLLIQEAAGGSSHRWNKERLVTSIIDHTGISYEDAKSAVKRVEEILAHKKPNGAIGSEELTYLIDLALMERGFRKDHLLKGREIGLSFDDVNQMIFSRSVENSNIQANNPEAVNLGISELVLKALALREIYDSDVAEAHKQGAIHVHDLGYPIRTYCSAHSIEYIKKFGLDKVVENLDAKSSAAKHPFVLNNHIHTFLAAIQSSYAGALGFPMVNTLYGPALLEEVEIVEFEESLNEEIVRRKMRRETLDELVDTGEIVVGKEVSSKRILRKRSYKELKQIAQNLVFGASQSAFSRGGQTLFIDFNYDISVPSTMTEVPAMFLGGDFLKVRENEDGDIEVVERTCEELPRFRNESNPEDRKNGDVIQPDDGSGEFVTYGHQLVREAAREFLHASLDVFEKGDKYGRQFNFPKCDIHVGRETFETKEGIETLERVCEVIEANGSPYIMYDRGDGMNVAQCCRLRERITDPEILKHPEKMRFCGFQNVSINLPHAAFQASGESLDERFESTLGEIDKAMILALKAHMNKKNYIQRLLDSDGTPLRAMGKPSDDGDPYIDLDKATYIIGVLGLNELVQHLTGKELHEDVDAFKLGLRVLSHMYSVKERFIDEYGLKFVIEETPGESANRRMAKLDLINHPEKAKKVLKGSLEDDEVYFTNSAHLRPDAKVDGLDRSVLQAMSNPMIEAGAITHVFSGEEKIPAGAAYDFIETVFNRSQSSQIVFSGEYTSCLKCGRNMRGLLDICPYCKNEDATMISQKTRVVGYFSDPRKWHLSKQGELKDRQKARDFYANKTLSIRDLRSELLKSEASNGEVKIGIVGKKGCGKCEAVEKRAKKFVESLDGEFDGEVIVQKYDITNEEDRVSAAIYGLPLDTYPSVVVQRGDQILTKTASYDPRNPEIIKPSDIKGMFEKISRNGG